MNSWDARTLAVTLVALTLVAVGGPPVAATAPTDAATAPTGTATPTSAMTATDTMTATDVRTATEELAQTTVDSCTTIDEPGNYVLTADVENGGETAISGGCIEITADDVTFDGNGHTIDGRGVSHTKGVAVVGASGVTVTNFAVDDWHAGVLVENGSATVRGVRTFSNAYGVRLENARGSTVANSAVENNLVGIYTNSADVTFEDNEISDNEMSIKRDYDAESNLLFWWSFE